MQTKITVYGGKYTLIHNNGNDFHALRYGDKWRDLTGDGMALALVQRIEELQQANQSLLNLAKDMFEGREQDWTADDWFSKEKVTSMLDAITFAEQKNKEALK